MASIRIIDILNKVYGPKGLPFPSGPLEGEGTAIAGVGRIAEGFDATEQYVDTTKRSDLGTEVRKYDGKYLGSYEFLPATIKSKSLPDGYGLPNALVIISGEKSIVETDVVDVGTVFEKVFTRPYDISIICTLIGNQKEWPERDLKKMAALWQEDNLVTLQCALTDIFLQAKDNFLITKISFLDAQGAENVEVIQIDGRSNIDFKLELI